MQDVYGIILAGGQGRRLGGVDKAFLDVGGRTALQRVLRRLAPQCAGLALNANGDPARFAEFSLPVTADDRPEHLGPLAGVLAGLDYVAAARPQVAEVVTVPVDTVFIPPDLVTKLRAGSRRSNAAVAVARSAGRAHYTAALWSVTLRQELRRALFEEELRKVATFMERAGACFVDWDATPFDPFFNINDAEDLSRARAIAAVDDEGGPRPSS